LSAKIQLGRNNVAAKAKKAKLKGFALNVAVF